jgi:hypothetical protein
MRPWVEVREHGMEVVQCKALVLQIISKKLWRLQGVNVGLMQLLN